MSILTRDQPVLRRWPSHVALGLTVACAFLGTSACSSGSDQESKTKTPSSASSTTDKDSEPSPSNDPQAIPDTWKAYQKALLAKDGAATADLVTEDTFEYYGQLRDKALDMGAADLRKQPALDQFGIVTLRVKIPARTLREASPRKVFELGVKGGTTDTVSAKQISLAKGKITGNTAEAVVMMDGKETEMTMHLKYQGGHWRLQILDNVKIANKAMTTLASQAEMSVEELVKKALVQLFGEAKTTAAYKPLGRA